MATGTPDSTSRGDAGLVRSQEPVRPWEFGLAVAIALGLTVVFWLPLWTGGGLVGSDIYAYFLPQKAFFAEELRAGSLPLWNPRIGWGYPQLAESQTGVFYPLHWPLYALFDLNTAYNAGVLVHYVLAFVAAWAFARAMGLKMIGALLAALVYVYGWFPSRICLEWAIVGGAWLPVALWCVERFLRTRFWRYAMGLGLVLALQMLAGHFTLAFVTQLTVALYVPLRLWFAAEDLPEETRAYRPACLVALAAAVTMAFALAAVQLAPTWELKGESQRQIVSAEHDPGYGYIPWKYLSQCALPWCWYGDDQAFKATVAPGGSRTNQVEAHLYFGLIPLALALWGGWRLWRMRDRRLLVWCLLGILTAIYTTGWLLPVTRHLPGFSFFEGPGRFGLVSTLAVGLLAGSVLDGRWFTGRPIVRWGLLLTVFCGTIVDLWEVSRLVTFAVLVERPPVKELAESAVGRVLGEEPQPVRIFSEAKNLPSMLKVGTLPTYLGLGPAAYFDPQQMYPGALDFAAPPTGDQVKWLQQAGVTHLLSFVPLEGNDWPAQRIWSGIDRFLNPALARGGDQPLYLYRLKGSRDRIAWQDADSPTPPRLVSHTPRRVEIEVEQDASGTLVLTDLNYPGWSVEIDGEEASPLLVDRRFRSVLIPAGSRSIVWTYRPKPLYWGGVVSGGALLLLLAVGHVRFWHPHIFELRNFRMAHPLR